MRALKFVPAAALDDHLQAGWVFKYPASHRARHPPKAAWLVWAGEGYPRHPEAERLMAGFAPNDGEASWRRARGGLMAKILPMDRQMTRDDRRLIWQKLNETYHSEDAGYQPGWTDHKVSLALDCPLPWVATVREEYFGTFAGSELDMEIVRSKNVIAAIKRQTEQIRTDVAKIRRTVENSIAEMTELLGRIDRGEIAQVESVRRLIGKLDDNEKRLKLVIEKVNAPEPQPVLGAADMDDE